MKSALLVRPGVIEIDDLPEPSLGPDDVRIAVGGVGLCGSDLSVFSGRWTAPNYPWIMGHEAFGIVEDVGERVPPSRVGETVVVEPNAACFRCPQCERGRTSACIRRASLGMNRPGALAEKLVVPSEFAWRIHGRAASDLVCVEPLAVVEAALRRLATPIPPSALVVAVGPQGLLMCLAMSRRGIRVYAVDVNEDRVAFAATLGAEPLPVEPDDLQFDLVVDTVGTPASIETALSRTDIGGTLLLLGLDSRPFELSSQALVRRQVTIRGSLTYDHPGDFRATIELVQDGHVSPGRVVSSEFPLEDAQRAFETSGSAPGKTWIRIGPPSASA